MERKQLTVEDLKKAKELLDRMGVPSADRFVMTQQRRLYWANTGLEVKLNENGTYTVAENPDTLYLANLRYIKKLGRQKVAKRVYQRKSNK